MLYQVDLYRFQKGNANKRRSTHTLRRDSEVEVLDEFIARYGDDIIGIAIEPIEGSNSKASNKEGREQATCNKCELSKDLTL